MVCQSYNFMLLEYGAVCITLGMQTTNDQRRIPWNVLAFLISHSLLATEPGASPRANLQLQNGSAGQFLPGNFAGDAIAEFEFQRFRRVAVLEQFGQITKLRCLFPLENRQER